MYEVSIQMFFQKEVKFLWAHHAFKFTAQNAKSPALVPLLLPPPPRLRLTFLHPVPSWSPLAVLHTDECVIKCHQR